MATMYELDESNSLQNRRAVRDQLLRLKFVSNSFRLEIDSFDRVQRSHRAAESTRKHSVGIASSNPSATRNDRSTQLRTRHLFETFPFGSTLPNVERLGRTFGNNVEQRATHANAAVVLRFESATKSIGTAAAHHESNVDEPTDDDTGGSPHE